MVNANNQQYHYDQGVYYVQVDNGYKPVPAPVGAKVTTLPVDRNFHVHRERDVLSKS